MVISVLGAGWLGLPLAIELIKEQHTIKGATTKTNKLVELKKTGIEPFQILFDPIFSGDCDFFVGTDVLIVNIPPKRRDDIVEYHVAQMQSVIQQTIKAGIKKVVLISSTSVYPDLNRIVTENDAKNPSKESGKALLLVEELFRNNSHFECTILRFAGLIGEDRKPGRFFAGKLNIPNGKAPINMIHLNDCIQIIKQIITKNVWGETFNAVASIHPHKQEFYIEAAKLIKLSPPTFINELLNFKIISNEKLIKSLSYSFIHNDPMKMLER